MLLFRLESFAQTVVVVIVSLTAVTLACAAAVKH